MLWEGILEGGVGHALLSISARIIMVDFLRGRASRLVCGQISRFPFSFFLDFFAVSLLFLKFI